MMQAKTALVETAGSKFLEECSKFLEEQRFDQFLSKMLSQLDLMFSKSESKGKFHLGVKATGGLRLAVRRASLAKVCTGAHATHAACSVAAACLCIKVQQCAVPALR